MQMFKKFKVLSLVMILSLIVSFFSGVNQTQAAKKISLKLNKTKASIQVKKSLTLKVKTQNVKKVKSVKWSTSKKSVAKVDSKGKVTALKAGKATITAKVRYIVKSGKKVKTKKLKSKITVKSAPVTSITPAATANATVTNPPAASENPSNVTSEPLVTRTPTPVSTPNAELKEANVVTDGKGDDTNIGEEHKSRYGAITKDNGIMRTNLSAKEIASYMGLGWNIGNSMEQTGPGNIVNMTEEEKNALTDEDWVKGYETNAGNPQSTQKMITGLKRYGINTIRIPIAWSNMMTVEPQADGTNYYRISEAYFNRVEEIMNYCLNEQMYVIINIHWDGQWWGMFGDEDKNIRAEAMKKYTDMWTQISNRYAEYSDRLIFEGANEELGERLNDNWKGDGGTKGVLTKEETYALTNEINQHFVDLIRKSGINSDNTKNNNYYRYLLIPGYDTNLHQTCGDKYSDKAKESNDAYTYKMPEDKEENGNTRLFVSIHYYDPLGWGIAKTAATYDTPKGKSSFMDTWGSEADYAAMQEDFDAVKEAYVDKGYGVIFGEFGVVSMNKDGIPDYFKQFFSSCKDVGGCVPVMWDEGGIVDRKGQGNGKYAYFIYEDIGQVFMDISGCVVELKEEAQKNTTITGKPANLVDENQDPLVVATWEGDFMRNTSGSGSVNYEAIKEVFGEDFIKTIQDNTTAANFKTDKITINPDEKYKDLKLNVTSDTSNWHSHFGISDWTVFKKPGIRITMNDDLISKSAQLQLVFTNGMWEGKEEYDWKYESDYEQVVSVPGNEYTDEQVAALPKTVNYITDGEKFSDSLPKLDENLKPVLAETAWQEKALVLNTKYLEKEPVVLLTTNTYLGVDFKKVEFVDLAYKSDGTEFVSEQN